MDVVENRTRAIAQMALNGLWERSKAISANTVNALTPNYKRKEVSFEKSLQNVIANEDKKEEMKEINSVNYKNNPENILKTQTAQRLAFLNSQPDDFFSMEITTDNSKGNGLDGNNVNIESEMMDESKNGLQYQVVAGLLSKSYKELQSVIKGQTE